MDAEILEKRFSSRGVQRGGTLWLPQSAASDFVRECERFGIEILGIDAAYLTPTTTRPSMQDSINFSSIPNDQRKVTIYQQALKFLAQYEGADIHFEIVV